MSGSRRLHPIPMKKKSLNQRMLGYLQKVPGNFIQQGLKKVPLVLTRFSITGLGVGHDVPQELLETKGNPSGGLKCSPYCFGLDHRDHYQGHRVLLSSAIISRKTDAMGFDCGRPGLDSGRAAELAGSIFTNGRCAAKLIMGIVGSN